MWTEITYPFSNFNGCTVEVLEWISYFIPHFYNGCNNLSMLGLKLNHISKRSPLGEVTRKLGGLMVDTSRYVCMNIYHIIFNSILMKCFMLCVTKYTACIWYIYIYVYIYIITWSYLWGGLVRGEKIISLSTLSYPKDDAHFVRLE